MGVMCDSRVGSWEVGLLSGRANSYTAHVLGTSDEYSFVDVRCDAMLSQSAKPLHDRKI